MARNYKQGKYEVKNPSKCINGTKEVRYLSSYELECWRWADNNKNVIRWGVETVVVPYYSSVKGRKARYLVDLYIEYYNRHGEYKKVLCEIKPFRETKKVRDTPGRKKSTVIQEQLTYVTNMEKWKAAKKYAEDRGWQFTILTEKEIFG